MMIDYYQTIRELNIVGRFNTPEEFEKIGLPKDLTDWSVLDIGCNIGAYMLECYKRGARRVDGVEPNLEWRLLAHGVLIESGLTEPHVYSLYKNIHEPEWARDLVLLLSVTHVVEGITGQEILDRAWTLTKKLLIVEINDRLQKEEIKLPEGAVFFGKSKDNRSVWHIWKK